MCPRRVGSWRVCSLAVPLAAGAVRDHRCGSRLGISARPGVPSTGHRRRPGLFRRPAQFVDEVGALPGETAVRLRRAAEMAISTGACIDRAIEAEMLPDAARGE